MRRMPLLILSLLLGLPAAGAAGPIHNFASLSPGANTSLGSGLVSVGPVTAQGFSFKSGVWAPDVLIARNVTNDHGLGVCSETPLSDCRLGGFGAGDWNELSQLEYPEAILFSIADGFRWTELWVSSLDGGGTGGTEEGRVHWGNSSAIASLLGGPSFAFDFGNFGAAVEGDILSLAAAAAFDPDARYVLFVPDGTVGQNNDYLVWGASTEPVPEPGTLFLLGTGAAALARARGRRARSRG